MIRYPGAATGLAFLIFALAAIAGSASGDPLVQSPTPVPAPPGRVASPTELVAAREAWSRTQHAETYDDGMGANATCARCKSPRNWLLDPEAAAEAMNCGACKRIPGAARPDLAGGGEIAPEDWRGITCDICHEPVGDSYLTAIAFWNQSLGRYEAVESEAELCAKCHEGRHGFEVIEEQAASPAHRGWACSRCHGAHGSPVACSDCHDTTRGAGAGEHARHPTVNCTACHDAGQLSIWVDDIPGSRHLGTYIPLRFAHALRSWPSHDLEKAVDCRRCHHRQGTFHAAVVSEVGCDAAACHPAGAVLNWCAAFARDPAPEAARQMGAR